MTNREQRRAQAKSKKSPAERHKDAKDMYVAEHRLMSMLREAYQEGEKAGFYRCLTVFCWELRNVYDFGEKRITRLVKKVIDLAESIEQGLVSVEDIQKQLEEETGILIESEERGFRYSNGKDD